MPADRLDDWSAGIPYRICYGLARAWQDRRPTTTMSDDPTPAEVAALVDEAKRRLSGPVDDELVREAIDDALNSRRPRW